MWFIRAFGVSRHTKVKIYYFIVLKWSDKMEA